MISSDGDYGEGETQHFCTPGHSLANCLSFELNPDGYPQDTSWKIEAKKSGKIIATGESRGDHCIIDDEVKKFGCYMLTVMDKHGDGLCCEYGFGGFKMEWGGKVVVAYQPVVSESWSKRTW